MDLNYLEPASGTITPCEAYTALFRLREQDAKRWAFAAYIVGITAALGLAAAILSVVFGANGVAIATGIGTVVTGAATKWIWDRRTQTQREAQTFLEKVNTYCSLEQKRSLGIPDASSVTS